jgi:hypothetical protein
MIWSPKLKRHFRIFDDFADLILAFLPSQKCDLVGLKKAIFKVTSYLFYHIFSFLTNRKLDLREIEKDVPSVLLALLSSNDKIHLVRGRESNVSGGP